MTKILIERWNDELAFRLPDEWIERFGFKEGDEIDSSVIEAGLIVSADEGSPVKLSDPKAND